MYRVLLLLWLSTGTGCASTEEKCAEAKDVALSDWLKYGADLERDKADADKTITDIGKLMRKVIEPRLSKAAGEGASERHDKTTGAWHRAFSALYQAACTDDEECVAERLKKRRAEEELTDIDDFLTKLGLVKEALASSAEAARGVAETIENDFVRTSLKTAKKSTAEAVTACQNL